MSITEREGLAPRGYVHLWRCSEGHPEVWHAGALCWQIWTLFMMRANGKSKVLRDGTPIPRGSFVTSYAEIQDACRWRRGRGWKRPARTTVMKWVRYLKDNGNIDLKADGSGLFITVCKYEDWNPVGGEKMTGKVTGQGDERCLSSIPYEEGKEGKEESMLPTEACGDKGDSEILDKLMGLYRRKVHSGARLTKGARAKLRTRLKEFEPKQLQDAILNFAKDAWWMHHCARKGVAWFFHSEDRIQGFIDMVPRSDMDGRVVTDDAGMQALREKYGKGAA